MTPHQVGDVTVRDHLVATAGAPVRVRDYLPGGGTAGRTPLVWVHGGGFRSGGLDQRESDAPARAFARRGRQVRTVAYRLARRPILGSRARPAARPNRFPAALDDVQSAVEDLQRKGDEVVLGGASAGACLAAAVTLRLRDRLRPLPKALALVYGTYHHELPSDAELEGELHGPRRLVFRPAMVRAMNLNYVGDPRLLAPGYAFPGGADLTGFPPSLLLDADNDRLRASGRAFGHELVAAGVDVRREVVGGSVHGFLDAPRSKASREGGDLLDRWLLAVDGAPSTPARGAAS